MASAEDPRPNLRAAKCCGTCRHYRREGPFDLMTATALVYEERKCRIAPLVIGVEKTYTCDNYEAKEESNDDQ